MCVQGVLDMIAETEVQRRGKYLDFLLHYFNLGMEKWEAYRAHKQKHQKSEVTDMINTILKQEGLNEGKLLGFNEGKINEDRNLLLILLPKKLGPMPPHIEQLIRRTTDFDRIHTVLISLLELQSWQEVETLLAGNGKNV